LHRFAHQDEGRRIDNIKASSPNLITQMFPPISLSWPGSEPAMTAEQKFAVDTMVSSLGGNIWVIKSPKGAPRASYRGSISRHVRASIWIPGNRRSDFGNGVAEKSIALTGGLCDLPDRITVLSGR
jgi:hypothetical protein